MAVSKQDLLDAAFLANAAYYNDSDALLAGLSGSQWVALGSDPVPSGEFAGEQLPEPNGVSSLKWDSYFGEGVGDSNFLFDNGNSQAFVARNKHDNSLAIAFRGTAGAVDAYQDFKDGLVTSFLSGYDDFSHLIESLEQYISSKGITKVLVTGHSLGGVMAELFMAHHPLGGNVEYTGITFGSPGDESLIVNDPRLINFGHTEDPVVNSADEWRKSFRDVAVDIPFVDGHQQSMSGFGEWLLHWMSTGDSVEQAMSRRMLKKEGRRCPP